MSIEIYTNDNCRFCESAKALLAKLDVNFIEHSLLEDSVRTELQKRAPSARTLPQIFINQFHVGGFEDLQAIQKSGKLIELLQD